MTSTDKLAEEIRRVAGTSIIEHEVYDVARWVQEREAKILREFAERIKFEWWRLPGTNHPEDDLYKAIQSALYKFGVKP